MVFTTHIHQRATATAFCVEAGPWELSSSNIQTMASIELASWSSYDNSGWTTISVMWLVLKSHDGAEHRAHTAVLSAASVFLKNLLAGLFLEAERVQ